jgi:predicted GNAT family acetyltransferase
MAVDLERVTVEHDPAKSRWVARVGDAIAVADYMRDGETITFTHTFVPPEIEGQGVANKLVRAALDDARARGLRIAPLCQFVRVYMRRHREYDDLLAPGFRPATTGGADE